MSREIMQQALDALDMAQALLERSRHHDQILNAYKSLRDELAKPEQEQEPISTNDHLCAMLRQVHDVLACTALPMKRQWVGLTDEEIKEVLDLNVAPWSLSGVALQHVMDDARALEAKLKEKNGA